MEIYDRLHALTASAVGKSNPYALEYSQVAVENVTKERAPVGSQTKISWFPTHGLVTIPAELLHCTFCSASVKGINLFQCNCFPSPTLAQDDNTFQKAG
jgi:hypothetical protein